MTKPSDFFKTIAVVDACSVQVASLALTGYTTDTQDTHFSFALFDIDPVVFVDALNEVITQRKSNELYNNVQEIILRSSKCSDRITILREGNHVGISRGNIKILYYGSVDRLLSVPEAILKAVKKYQKKLDKEFKNQSNEY
jgi:hypothetical protein